MNLRDIFDRILTESGQYLFTLDGIELKVHSFKHLVQSTLHDYNKYSPKGVKMFANIEGSREHTFTEDSEDCNGNVVGIPDWLSDAVPIRISGTVPFLLRPENRINPELQCKNTLPFQYNKPILTVSVSAEYIVEAVFRHRLVCKEDTPNTNDPKQWEIKTLTEEDGDFFGLLAARFMKTVGRSRRAFTIEDLPISADADTLVSDGKEKEAEVIEDLQANACIDLGMGG